MLFYFSPISTYSQKTLIGLYEKNVNFTPKFTNLMNPEERAAYKKVYPLGKLPLLVLEGGHMIPESTTILEYVDQNYSTGPKLIPSDPETGRKTRFFDRAFDLHLNEPFKKIFFDAWKPENKRDPEGVAEAKETIDITYKFVEHALEKGPWVMGNDFTLADCSIAPSLGYLRQVQPFTAFPRITSYWSRLSERPSVARVLREAEPILKQLAQQR